MLHVEDNAIYRQASYMPPLPVRPAGRTPELYVPVMGRLSSHGGFDLQSIARHFSVHVVTGGTGWFESAGRVFPVKAGDVFVHFPGRHVRYRDCREAPWRYTYFNFEGQAAEWVLELAGLTAETPCREGGYDQRLEPLFREVETAYAGIACPPLFPLTMAWRLGEALAALHRAPRPDGLERDIAAATRFLLDQEYRTCPSLLEIARRLGVTRFTVFRRFREAYGLSPKQYLDELRLDQASRLLRESRSSVKEIARACGFASLPYFSRAFRRRFRLSPSQWREP